MDFDEDFDSNGNMIDDVNNLRINSPDKSEMNSYPTAQGSKNAFDIRI